jgi:hypothetical protein
VVLMGSSGTVGGLWHDEESPSGSFLVRRRVALFASAAPWLVWEDSAAELVVEEHAFSSGGDRGVCHDTERLSPGHATRRAAFF